MKIIKNLTQLSLLIALLTISHSTYAKIDNVISVSSPAQKDKPTKKQKKIAKKARKALRKKDYYKAKSYYDQLTKPNLKIADYWYEAGYTYFNSGVDMEKALPKLEKSLELSTEKVNPDLLMTLGDVYHYSGEFEKAIEFYNKYKTEIKDKKKVLELEVTANRRIEISNNGIDLRSQTLNKDIIIQNMGDLINSPAGDYAPVLSTNEDLLLFCSRRYKNKKTGDGQYFEDIFYTTKVDGQWKQAVVIDKNSGYMSDELNRGKRHEAPISLSPDGNSLFIYTENSVWKSEKDSKGQWTTPERMNQNVNIGKQTPSVFITPNGKEMFIVASGAKGGLGGRDIYHTTILEDGTWAEPKNLGLKINTPYNEDAPFVSKDGKTLYFSSEGHNTMGGYDIFRSTLDENGEWSEPMNIGTPINSAGNDIYYIENESGSIAYFSSQRQGTQGFLDIYSIEYACKNIPTTTIKGYAIYANSHQPINGVIKITNKSTGEEMGTFTTDSKGIYNMVLPPNETYILELVVAQSKYNQVRPHTEEFFIPKQCESYNLFQQIAINYIKDESGVAYAQKAHFKNAMFDIETEVENSLKSDGVVNTTYADSTSYIQGELAYNSILKAKDVTVTLLNNNNEIVRITKTDDNGEFAFEQIDIKQKYKLLINEDEAKRNYFGDNEINKESTITVEGKFSTINGETKEALKNTTILLANTDNTISNYVATDSEGNFKMSNKSENKDDIAQLNGNTVISYNLNIPTKEVLFSAFVTNIDPNNTDLAYTEYIDIIELKEIDTDEMPEFANIYFDFDKYFLRDKSQSILDNLYSYLNDHPTATIRLDGHTDWLGTEPYNDKLSENRTLKAYKYLIDKGIAPNRLVNEWFGEKKPAVANANADGSDNPENRQLNRRVEIKVEIPEMAALYIQL